MTFCEHCFNLSSKETCNLKWVKPMNLHAHPEDGSFLMDTPYDTVSYIERSFDIPSDAINLSARIWGAKNMDGASWCGEPVTTTVSIIDNGNTVNDLDSFMPIQMDNGIGGNLVDPRNYSLMQYIGQTVKVRLSQTSGYGHCTYGYYQDIEIQTS